MSNIDRVGSFRGLILDRGVGTTKNGYPQLLLQLQAHQHWNEEGQVWEEWNYEECEAQAYICLFGGSGKATLGVQQAMKALGWDGTSLAALQEDLSVEQIQWRMETNTYEGTTRLQVAWIDAYDAEPGRKVRKLDTADIKKLDAKYAAALKQAGGGPKPVSARPSAPKPADPPIARPGTPTAAATEPEEVLPADPTQAGPDAEAVVANAETPPAQIAGPEVRGPLGDNTPPKPKRGRLAKPPAAPKATAVSQDDAYKAVYEAGVAKGCTVKQINEAWCNVVREKGGDDQVGEDWSGVRDVVIAGM